VFGGRLTPLLSHSTIELARASDAQTLALLSRETIEQGLAWSWRPRRVLASIRASNTNVVVIRGQATVNAFAMMHYTMSEAYLALLAVRPGQRRRGLASGLLQWLERTALTAGIGVVHLEALASNHGGRAFYRARGYREIEALPRHYQDRMDGVRLAKDLWDTVERDA